MDGTYGPDVQAWTGDSLAAASCYFLFWLSGFFFLMIDRRPFVRYHAAQSVILFGSLHLAHFAIVRTFDLHLMLSDWAELSVGWIFLAAFNLLAFCLWVGCMWKAGRGQLFEVPLAGLIAHGFDEE